VVELTIVNDEPLLDKLTIDEPLQEAKPLVELTIDELKIRAKECGIKNYWLITKKEALIARIVEAEG
jgi:hypothetical protein